MMYEFIQKHCLSKKGVIEDYKEEWDAVRYFIGGKMFAMVGNYKDGRPIVSLKRTPEYGIEVQEKYPDIIPGYYLNKVHWSSIFIEGNVPEKILREMIDQSYELVFKSLTKSVQKEILDR
ncbi:MAG: DNA-binding protein [Bacteroidetes bacterium GWF2_39_10]|nr:MAG: DNA-binding protein [Bacteroidetes bacterium GWF2_39_10]OFZ07163.1 MAG: DNA-binding protein [Bacteroidetes bacterium RIFOXYB2_FULL_39_7]OFZ10794.1 MAG: DNA-binding protein [Bacteroidetes bacterium RIFOXYC2_FULL_39_11]HCT94005.1 DNA-binding protein [Rikenellaceae bacterium]